MEKKVKRNDLQVPIYGLSDVGLIHRFSDSIYDNREFEIILERKKQ